MKYDIHHRNETQCTGPLATRAWQLQAIWQFNIDKVCVQFLTFYRYELLVDSTGLILISLDLICFLLISLNIDFIVIDTNLTRKVCF